jgi:hypothetical protein
MFTISSNGVGRAHGHACTKNSRSVTDGVRHLPADGPRAVVPLCYYSMLLNSLPNNCGRCQVLASVIPPSSCLDKCCMDQIPCAGNPLYLSSIPSVSRPNKRAIHRCSNMGLKSGATKLRDARTCPSPPPRTRTGPTLVTHPRVRLFQAFLRHASICLSLLFTP